MWSLPIRFRNKGPLSIALEDDEKRSLTDHNRTRSELLVRSVWV